MIDKVKIEENKKRFLNLISKITREKADINALIIKLEGSDFFTAPASTQFHSSYEGGLCQHCLNVFDQMINLLFMEYPEITTDLATGEAYKEPDWSKSPYTLENVIITALLHDMSKMNFYETSFRNTKDETGTWIKVPYIAVRDAKNRFIYSNHGVNSAFMVNSYIPLTPEESAAIINHMGANGETVGESIIVSQVYNKYSLALLLHVADMLATFLLEKIL